MTRRTLKVPMSAILAALMAAKSSKLRAPTSAGPSPLPDAEPPLPLLRVGRPPLDYSSLPADVDERSSREGTEEKRLRATALFGHDGRLALPGSLHR